MLRPAAASSDTDASLDAAAEALLQADFLLVSAGAGFSADSGCKTYDNIANVPAYLRMGVDYGDLCDPVWLDKDPEIFFGFWGMCLNSYRKAEPHRGYDILLRWKDTLFHRDHWLFNQERKHEDEANKKRGRIPKKKKPAAAGSQIGGGPSRNRPASVVSTGRSGRGGAARGRGRGRRDAGPVRAPPRPFFVYTSNVDSFFRRAGFEMEEVFEVHGNVDTWQCSVPCCNTLWKLDSSFRFEVNEDSMRAPRRRQAVIAGECGAMSQQANIFHRRASGIAEVDELLSNTAYPEDLDARNLECQTGGVEEEDGVVDALASSVLGLRVTDELEQHTPGLPAALTEVLGRSHSNGASLLAGWNASSQLHADPHESSKWELLLGGSATLGEGNGLPQPRENLVVRRIPAGESDDLVSDTCPVRQFRMKAVSPLPDQDMDLTSSQAPSDVFFSLVVRLYPTLREGAKVSSPLEVFIRSVRFQAAHQAGVEIYAGDLLELLMQQGQVPSASPQRGRSLSPHKSRRGVSAMTADGESGLLLASSCLVEFALFASIPVTKGTKGGITTIQDIHRLRDTAPDPRDPEFSFPKRCASGSSVCVWQSRGEFSIPPSTPFRRVDQTLYSEAGSNLCLRLRKPERTSEQEYLLNVIQSSSPSSPQTSATRQGRSPSVGPSSSSGARLVIHRPPGPSDKVDGPSVGRSLSGGLPGRIAATSGDRCRSPTRVGRKIPVLLGSGAKVAIQEAQSYLLESIKICLPQSVLQNVPHTFARHRTPTTFLRSASRGLLTKDASLRRLLVEPGDSLEGPSSPSNAHHGVAGPPLLPLSYGLDENPNHSRCRFCKQLARPNVLMFEDDAWVEVSDAKYVSWEQTIKTEMEASKEENAPKKLVILEIGCGTRVPTVRMNSERLVRIGLKRGWTVTLIRINPQYPRNRHHPKQTISIKMTGLAALRRIHNLMIEKLDNLGHETDALLLDLDV